MGDGKNYSVKNISLTYFVWQKSFSNIPTPLFSDRKVYSYQCIERGEPAFYANLDRLKSHPHHMKSQKEKIMNSQEDIAIKKECDIHSPEMPTFVECFRENEPPPKRQCLPISSPVNQAGPLLRLAEQLPTIHHAINDNDPLGLIVSQPEDSQLRISDVMSALSTNPIETENPQPEPATETIGRRYQIEIKGRIQRGLILHMPARMKVLREFLNKRDLTLGAYLIPPTMDNPLYKPLLNMYKRKCLELPVPETDEHVYTIYKGFLYLPGILKFLLCQTSKRYKSSIADEEFIVSYPSAITHPYFCHYCTVIHSYSESPHPQPCMLLNTNGPKILTDLLLDPKWINETQALCLGHYNLYYLPSTLKSKVINLADFSLVTYNISTNMSDLMQPPSTGTGTLTERIMKVITAVGKECQLPILIEFFENPQFPNTGMFIFLQLLGFINTVYFCQQHYQGPIVVLIPPIRARKNDTRESYQERVKKIVPLQRYGHYIGLTLGVPVVHIPVQVTEQTSRLEKIYYESWIPGPLFSSVGNFTREYMNRIHSWFEHFLPYLTIDPNDPPEQNCVMWKYFFQFSI